MMAFLRRLAPTPTSVRLLLVPALAFVALCVDRQYLMDFWHHLARGRAMALEGRLVNHDAFTFTVAGQPLQDVNWLSQLAYYGLYRLGGLALVQLANAALTALTLLLVVLVCRRRCGRLGVAVAVGVFTFVGLWQLLTIRPQTFSLLLFVVLLHILERAEANGRWLLLPPVLLGLWANLHGAFPAGLMLLGCYGLAAAWQAWTRGALLRDWKAWTQAVCLVGSTLATLINPYGWGIYLYVGQTSGRAAARGIQEWLPPGLDMLVGMAWASSVALLAVLALAAWRRGWRPRAHDVFLTLCFLLLACGSVRMVAWWLLVFAPLSAELLGRLLPARAPDPAMHQPSWGAGLTFAALAAVAMLSVPGLERFNPLFGFTGRVRPTETALEEAGRCLAARGGTGRVFSRFEWGEYLGWAGAPRWRVFMDGRIEIIPDGIWQDYLRLTHGQDGWQKVLDDYAINDLVLDADYHAQTGLLAQVERSPAWQRARTLEAGVVLFQRRPALHAANIGRR